MAAKVEALSRTEIEARKRALLDRAAMSEDELRSRGEDYALTGAQAAILDELEDLDFLLDK
jgi:hypothetical protein